MKPPFFLIVLLVAGVAGYIWETRPNPDGVLYRVPIAEARRDLAKAELPPLVFGSQVLDTQVRNYDAQVVWIVSRQGEELFRYTAALKPEGDTATRVKVKIEGAQGRTENYAQKLASKPQIRDMYVVAMEERVASTLERRSFEMARIYPAMSAAVVSNMGAIHASVDEAAAESNQLARINIEKAYRDEATGVRRR